MRILAGPLAPKPYETRLRSLLAEALRHELQGTLRGTGLTSCGAWVLLLCSLGAPLQ